MFYRIDATYIQFSTSKKPKGLTGYLRATLWTRYFLLKLKHGKNERNVNLRPTLESDDLGMLHHAGSRNEFQETLKACTQSEPDENQNCHAKGGKDVKR